MSPDRIIISLQIYNWELGIHSRSRRCGEGCFTSGAMSRNIEGCAPHWTLSSGSACSEVSNID
jgi:hypothetical protein